MLEATTSDSRNITWHKREGFEVSLYGRVCVCCLLYSDYSLDREAVSFVIAWVGRKRMCGEEALAQWIDHVSCQVCGVQGPEGGHR